MQQQEKEARVERQEREERQSGRVHRAAQRSLPSADSSPCRPEPAPPLGPLHGEDFICNEHGEKDANASLLGKKRAGLRRGFLNMLAGESGSDEEDPMPWRSSPAAVSLH